jgi:hypothetical protein
VADISIIFPSCDFVDEGLFVRDTLIEALGRKDAKLGFRHIEPTDARARKAVNPIPLLALAEQGKAEALSTRARWSAVGTYSAGILRFQSLKQGTRAR